MKKSGIFVFFIVVILAYTTNVNARRGCCSWHGGVSSGCSNGRIICNDGTTSPSCTCDGGSSSSSNYVTKTTPSYVYGCMDSDSINYNSNATKDNGSCIKKVMGCTDQNAYNYNENANTDDGSCIAKVEGCTNKDAENYNSDANIPNGTCTFRKIKITYKKIKYKTEYKYSFFSKKGKVVQKGKNGKMKIKTRIITNENNEIIEKKIILKEIIKKPITKVIIKK